MSWFPGAEYSTHKNRKKSPAHSPKNSGSLAGKKATAAVPPHYPHSPLGKAQRLGKERIHSPKPHKPAPSLAHRAEPGKPSTPAAKGVPSLNLDNLSIRLLKEHDTAIQSIKTCKSKLAATTDDAAAWRAYEALGRASPLSRELLQGWIKDILKLDPPRAFDSKFAKLLRSSSGREILAQLDSAFQEITSQLKQLNQLKLFYKSLIGHGKSINISENWKRLPNELQVKLSTKVRELSGNPPEANFGRKQILKHPHVLYSLSGQNIVQNETTRLEEQIQSILQTKKSAAAKKCLHKLMNVDLAPFKSKIAHATSEIRQLKILKHAISEKNIYPNKAIAEFFHLDETTTSALEYLIWIADGKPQNGDFRHGLHRLETNIGLLETISEESTNASLIDWAIFFYERQIENYSSLAELRALEKVLKTETSHSTDSLLWAFYSCNHESIQAPLVKLAMAQGFTREDLDKNPRILVLEKTIGQPSPLASLIANKKKLSSTSIHSFVENAQKNQTIQASAERPSHEIGVERFPEEIQEHRTEPKNIALLTPEYSKVFDAGGLAPAIHGLAQSLAKTGNVVKVIMPYYKTLLPKELLDAAVEKRKYAISDGTKDNKPCRVMKIRMRDVASVFGLKESDQVWAKNIKFYMIDPTSEKHKDIFVKAYGGKDEARRFLYFQSAAVELIHKMDISSAPGKKKIDVFHANDWQTSFVAMGMYTRYPKQVPPNVFAIHNNAYHPVFSGSMLSWADLRRGDSHPRDTLVEGVQHADQVVTVSRNFAVEVQSKEVGFGIDPFFRDAATDGRLSGIINGNNTAAHDPSNDGSLRNWIDPITGEKVDLTYSAADDDETLLTKKRMIKEQLQKWFDCYYPEAQMAIDPDPKKPLFFYIGRLVDQKGLDLLEPVIDKIQAEGGQLVAIGMGDETMDPTTKGWLLKAKRHVRDKWAGTGTAIILDEWVSNTKGARVRKYQQGDGIIPGIGSVLRSAADIFFMPSKYEPCGLTQGEAKARGTLFTVGTKTGGLCDTEITPENTDDPTKITGFLCPRIGNYRDWHKPAQMKAFVDTIGKAMKHYRSLTEEQRAAQMRYVMNLAAKSSWATSPDETLPPVDQYRVLYSAAQHLPRQKRKIRGPRLKIGLPGIA